MDSVVLDTVKYMVKEDVISFYKDMLQSQQSNYTIIVTVLLGLMALNLGITWWWNKVGAEKYMQEEIERRVNAKLSESINLSEEKLKHSLTKVIEVKLDAYNVRVMRVELNTNRSLAHSLAKEENYFAAVSYWAEALWYAIKLDEGSHIRVFAEEILKELKALEKAGKMKVYKMGSIKKSIEIMPAALIREKVAIEKLLIKFESQIDDDTIL